jgi:hypothetical protein
MELSRRRALWALGAVGFLAAVPACSAPFAETKLRVATGGTQGLYFTLGTALAEAWRAALKLDAAPEVIVTAGSRENIELLAADRADVAFGQLDTAADHLASADPRPAGCARWPGCTTTWCTSSCPPHRPSRRSPGCAAPACRSASGARGSRTSPTGCWPSRGSHRPTCARSSWASPKR